MLIKVHLKKRRLIIYSEAELADLENSIKKDEKLSDLHINFAHYENQFLQKEQITAVPTKNQLQMIHYRGDHWIATSNVGCENGDVNVFDSIYKSLDKPSNDCYRK